MTIKEALKKAKNILYYNQNYAIYILCEYLQKERSWLFLNENFCINEKEYFDLIHRFDNGEPFEYIFGKAYFYGMDFKIVDGVLIPRYDSEVLLHIVLSLCKKRPNLNILEIGFGSGILSIVLAKKLGVKITACDINEKALDLAIENAKIHKVENLIDFRLCDFKDIKENFDFVFSNPPYIKNDYKLDKWVLKEPKNALFGGEFGWEILQDIVVHFKNIKYLACEFGYDQKEILDKILKENNFKSKFFKDENGFFRAFYAKKENTCLK